MSLVRDMKRDIVRTLGITRDIVWPNGPLGNATILLPLNALAGVTTHPK